MLTDARRAQRSQLKATRSALLQTQQTFPAPPLSPPLNCSSAMPRPPAGSPLRRKASRHCTVLLRRGTSSVLRRSSRRVPTATQRMTYAARPPSLPLVPGIIPQCRRSIYLLSASAQACRPGPSSPSRISLPAASRCAEGHFGAYGRSSEWSPAVRGGAHRGGRRLQCQECCALHLHIHCLRSHFCVLPLDLGLAMAAASQPGVRELPALAAPALPRSSFTHFPSGNSPLAGRRLDGAKFRISEWEHGVRGGAYRCRCRLQRDGRRALPPSLPVASGRTRLLPGLTTCLLGFESVIYSVRYCSCSILLTWLEL